MYYSSIGVIAILIHLIINYDVFRKTDKKTTLPAHRSYRLFLLAVLGFYATDVCWGLFYHFRLIPIAYIDTEVYFAVMAFSVFLWIKYVVSYLNEKSLYNTVLLVTGWVFLIGELLVLLVNLFVPIVFWFDADGEYHIGNARSINLIIQLVMFLITTGRMFYLSGHSTGKIKLRSLTIALFGLFMTIFVALQALYPLMPFYSLGYMLGTCLLHTFVLEDEKEDRRREIEELVNRERKQEEELGSARQLAYTDSLTGVKNKHAYLEAETIIEQKIGTGLLSEFGVIVFDLNGLKDINDSKGHDAGDQYLKSACKLICQKFKHSPVFRIGGDEFVVFLEGEDYKNHETLLKTFNMQIEKNLEEGSVVISCGFSDFKPGNDKSFLQVFERADKKMYIRKHELKNIPLGE